MVKFIGVCAAAVLISYSSISALTPADTIKANTTAGIKFMNSSSVVKSIMGSAGDFYTAGKLGVGSTTSFGPRAFLVGAGSGNINAVIYSGTSNWSSIYFADGQYPSSAEYEGAVQYYHGDNHMDFYTNHTERMRITSSGQVAIGKTSASFNLDVAGGIRADSIIAGKIKINNWTLEAPDYVFDKNYSLPKLQHVEKFIKQNSHLPEVPSAKQMKQNGVDLVEMNMILLKKLEETTLYLIEQDKRIKELESKVAIKN